MSRKAAAFTQAEIKRITAAAKAKGAVSVDIISVGGNGLPVTFHINLKEPDKADKQPAAPKKERYVVFR